MDEKEEEEPTMDGGGPSDPWEKGIDAHGRSTREKAGEEEEGAGAGSLWRWGV